MATAEYSVKVGAAGTGTITVRTPSIRSWTVAKVTMEIASPGTAPSGATADIRKNGYLVSLMIPNGDVAAGEPYELLRNTDTLTLNWYGCTQNTIGKAMVYYTET